MKKILGALALLTVGVMSAPVAANTLNMKHTGMLHSNSRQVTTSMTTVGLLAGAIRWDGVSTDAGRSFTTFCTEITQVANNVHNEFTVKMIHEAPVPGPPMGHARAQLVSRLYSIAYSDAIGNRDDAAAFQIALWEIVHETNFADIGSVDTGDFVIETISGSAADQLAIRNQANNWLTAIVNWQGGPVSSGLRALTNAYNQDQIIVIPLPAPVIMAGLGLIALPVLRRRVMRS